MKAILLAGGLGSRLKPITNEIPKCLIPINGKPLLEYWFMLFKKYGVTDVLINLHHLSQKVIDFCNEYSTNNDLEKNKSAKEGSSNEKYTKESFAKEDSKIRITLVYEPELLGSAGTILTNKNFVQNEKQFYILYADNLTNVDLTSLARQNRISNMPLTVGLFKTPNPTQCGIAELNENNIITNFIEKPTHPKNDLASAGIFVATNKLFDFFPAEQTKFPFDLGADVMPNLVGAMDGLPLDCYIRDIGTHQSLKIAELDAKKIFT